MINWNPTGRRVYFLSPHQDDETLFMAQVLAHHVLANREVHVILMGNGSTSSVLQKLSGEIHTGPWWGGFHYPDHEGYEPLNQTEFGRARTDEMRTALRHLGVPPERLHFGAGLESSEDLPDATSQSYAANVLEYWMAHDLAAGREAPGFYSMHWTDPTSDHAHIGAALRAARVNDSRFADSRWLCKPELAAAAGAQPYTVPTSLQAEVKLMQKRAALAYGAWAPEQGAYAIGMHSVSAYFNGGPLAGAVNHIVRNP